MSNFLRQLDCNLVIWHGMVLNSCLNRYCSGIVLLGNFSWCFHWPITYPWSVDLASLLSATILSLVPGQLHHTPQSLCLVISHNYVVELTVCTLIDMHGSSCHCIKKKKSTQCAVHRHLSPWPEWGWVSEEPWANPWRSELRWLMGLWEWNSKSSLQYRQMDWWYGDPIAVMGCPDYLWGMDNISGRHIAQGK